MEFWSDLQCCTVLYITYFTHLRFETECLPTSSLERGAFTEMGGVFVTHLKSL